VLVINYPVFSHSFMCKETLSGVLFSLHNAVSSRGMNRRSLLKNFAWAAPGIFLVPSLFEACRKNLIIPENPYNGDIIIVGAGAAGIYAANLLRSQGIQVRILEAAAKPGGRIQANTNLADYPVELGAGKLIGQRSIAYDLAAYHTPGSIKPYTGTNFFLLDGLLRTEFYLKENAGLQGQGATLFQAIESFASYPGKEMSVSEYLESAQELNIEDRFLNIANALIGNELGADNNSLSMLAMKERASAESAGKKAFYLNDRSIWSLFEKAFPEEIALVQSGKTVNSIAYNNQGVTVKMTDGSEYTAGRVLLTVPLGILKKQSIQFNPPLPVSKSSAIDAIGFGSGIRIALLFSQPFWTEGTDLVMGGTTFPQYEINSANRSAGSHIVTATAMGEAAMALTGLSDAEIAARAISELGKFYPAGGVALKFTQKSVVKNWTDDPFTLGSISYPSPGSMGMREDLAAPVGNKLFFAGEATNYNGHSGSVHGAMETAYRAVEEILRS
jgi:monoamine oxidase